MFFSSYITFILFPQSPTSKRYFLPLFYPLFSLYPNPYLLHSPILAPLSINPLHFPPKKFLTLSTKILSFFYFQFSLLVYHSKLRIIFNNIFKNSILRFLNFFLSNIGFFFFFSLLFHFSIFYIPL